MPLQVNLAEVRDLDQEVLNWLRKTYEENL
jgi:hypothetical protein